MKKTKLLFVVSYFYRAGAERFMFEVDSVLNKAKYDVTILCLEKKAKIKPLWGSRYYEQRHRELGSKIYFIDSFLITHNLLKRINSKIKKVFFNKIYLSNIDTKMFNKFISNYEIVNWIGEYSFYHGLSKENIDKSLIYIMSAKFQDSNLYKKFNYEFNYNFVSGFNENECAFEFKEFKNINHYYLPLLLEIPFQHNPWMYRNSLVKKIGIFTRLDSRYKPLDPFFYSFQLLLEKLPNCELHIFGNGDPEKEGMMRYLRNLGITKSVFFRGHQENIVETVLKENIDLSWFQGHNNTKPGGYAGFDICTTGTPLVCWDFIDEPIDPFNETYPHYKSLTKFVTKSYELLTNPESAELLSNLQFIDIADKRDSHKHITVLDSIFNEILNV